MQSAKGLNLISRGFLSSEYRDNRYKGGLSELTERLQTSATLYVGNLSFYTTEEQLHELFSRVGMVRRVIIGLDKFKRTPCGFAFVEYYDRASAERCRKYISETKLDDRTIRCDWDAGFEEGRQYGRGRSGGQVRDELRPDFDSGRGGYGKQAQQMDAAPYPPRPLQRNNRPPFAPPFAPQKRRFDH